MNKDTLNNIKQNLLAEKTRIEQELKGMSIKEGQELEASFPDYGHESDDNAQEVSEYTTNLEANRVIEEELEDINKALKNIETGSYGTCKHCGQQIDERRLLVRPTSSSCIACKTKLQRGA